MANTDLNSFRQLTEQELTIATNETEALFVDLRNQPDPKSVELVNNIQSFCDTVAGSLLTEDAMTEKQIIKMVRAEFDFEPAIQDSEEENEEPPPACVNIVEALNALHILIQFQEQQEAEKGFKPEELAILQKKSV